MIACLGWGSLVWDPRELPIQRRWFEDGPIIKADFLRKSKDGRMTLVLDEAAESVRSLWAAMVPLALEDAKVALARREDTFVEKEHTRGIGSWTKGAPSPALIKELPDWAQARGVDHVIWTNLQQKFHPSGEVASTAEVLNYLDSLQGAARRHAEEYIRRAPLQIDTSIRRHVEARLGWRPAQGCQ